MYVLIDSVNVLEVIRKRVYCNALQIMVEDTTNLVLDLGDSYIYFILEQKNNKYRLTKHNFSNTLFKQSETRLLFKNFELLIEHIIDVVINKTKIKGILCKRK